MDYVSRRFRCAWKKVGSFTVVVDGGRVVGKQGGSVAAYFTTPAGVVLGAALGAVDEGFFLEEATWAAARASGAKGVEASHAVRADHLAGRRFR